jgi:ATP-dependent HslUV protease ATP-binding subunit HslU
MSDGTAFTPREVVSELDRYVVGQRDAKRAVAIALRNRWRRQRITGELQDEIAPKNIIMIGPTGVGKTEIARRLAKLARAPFLKVEASKFTEVGYVGRDVESIVRDLTDLAVQLVSEEEKRNVMAKARERAEDRVLEALGTPPEAREGMRRKLRDGVLDAQEIEIEAAAAPGPAPQLSVFTPQGGMPPGVEDMGNQLQQVFGNLFGGAPKKRRLKVPAALDAFSTEEAGKLIDMERVRELAVSRVEQSGIVFIDEIDKVAAGPEGRGAPDISRQGVQRDLLPIVEGSTVQTRHGPVRTDHVLFIAAGAFHVAKPSDLIPELQGRFPIRVELDSLGQDEFVRILTEPRNSLVRQYTALLQTEGVELEFTEEGVAALAEIAALANERAENIGARRLHTVMERLLDEISFDAPDRSGTRLRVDDPFVRERLEALVRDEDLARYIL